MEPQRRADPKPEREPPQRATAAPQGNSDRNATRGAATGSSSATAARQATSNSSSSEAGNAAMSNYRGKVFRRIARAKRGQVNVRGATIVTLTIGPTGQLTGVGVARSSGSARLDEIAVTQIRRAAPFPAPPNGQSQSYTVKISGQN